MARINMKAFCRKPGINVPEYALAPFVKGGWKYATDGACVIRVPCNKDDTAKVRLPSDKLERTFLAFEKRRPAAVPWPAVEPHQKCTATAYSDDCYCCHRAMEVDGLRFSLFVARRIARLPSVRFIPKVRTPEGGLLFVFDGGEGAVMPLTGRE